MDNVQTKIRKQTMVKMIGDSKDKIILDIGGGIIKISDLVKYKKRYVLDVDKSYGGVDIVCDLNEEEIPLPENSVDIVIAGEIIEHLKSPVNFLKKCKRILKSEGYIVLSTPNICSIKNRFKVLSGQLPEYCCISRMNGYDGGMNHVKDFSLSHLTEVVSAAGLKVKEAQTNGIILHSRLVFPRKFTPVSFGEILILKIGK